MDMLWITFLNIYFSTTQLTIFVDKILWINTLKYLIYAAKTQVIHKILLLIYLFAIDRRHVVCITLHTVARFKGYGVLIVAEFLRLFP